jgi:hypothetical protein
VARLYGLSREEFAHILGTFPLFFPGDAEGHRKKESLLGVYDEFGEMVKDWREHDVKGDLYDENSHTLGPFPSGQNRK